MTHASSARTARALIFAAGAVLFGCTGQVGPGAGQPPGAGGGAASAGGQPSSTGPTPMAECSQDRSLAPARVSLLSDDQYRNIIHDVFGVTFPETQVVSVQTNANGSYPFNEAATLAQQEVLQSYLRAADTVASLLQSIPPCASASMVNAMCMEQYLSLIHI